MYLTNLKPYEFTTHHAGVGLKGELGYSILKDSLICVNDQIYPYGIGAHAPAVVKFDLDGKYQTFTTKVGINHSAKDKYNGICDFYVYADDRLVGLAPRVVCNETPQLSCNIHNCKTLTIITKTSTPLHCHSVWLNPQLYTSASEWNISCYGTHKYKNTNINTKTKYCFMSVITDSYMDYFVNLYRTIKHYLSINDYVYIVYGVDLSKHNEQKLTDLGVHVIAVSPICDTTNLSAKFVALDAYQIIDCEYYVLFDADMLMVGDIADLLTFIPSYSQNQFSICRQTDVDAYYTFKDALSDSTNDSYRDYDLSIQKLNISPNTLSFTHALNSGFYIAGKEALCKASNLLNRLLPEAFEWEREKLDECWWREEALLTACIAQMNNCNIIPGHYNVQLQTKGVDFQDGEFYYNGQPCKMIHMVGRAREEKYNILWEQLRKHHGW